MHRLLGILLLAWVAGSLHAADESAHMAHYTVEQPFDVVKQDLELAITARGMVINNVAHIGEMLERTGKDLGAGTRIYEQAQALEFCSAVVSREMMAADPHNIVFCPYVIAIYVMPDQPEITHIAFRRPGASGDEASRQALGKVETLLREIIEEVTEF